MKRKNYPEQRVADRRESDRRKGDRKKGWTIVPKTLIVLALLGGVAYLWMMRNREEEQTAEQIRLPVRITYAERGTIRRTFKISGYVESEHMVTVLPKISGTLTQLWKDVEDPVYQGETIGLIDSEPYELTMHQAEAAYYAAKATYERMEQLYEAKATSKQNYDNAKSQYDATKSQYELAALNHGYTFLTAPISGVVLQKHSSRGSLVAPQIPILTIGDISNLAVKAKVPEKYYSFFTAHKFDMEITAELPALEDIALQAKVKTVSPYISPETKSFEVICTLSGNTEMLRPGMFVYLTFTLEKRTDVLFLPFTALAGGETLWYVEKESSRAKQIHIDASFYNNEVFQIDEKYKDYPFIFEGQHFLREGQECTVLNDTAQKE